LLKNPSGQGNGLAMKTATDEVRLAEIPAQAFATIARQMRLAMLTAKGEAA
jgi:hypothetical protein